LILASIALEVEIDLEVLTSADAASRWARNV
jgi:hypothetical protein